MVGYIYIYTAQSLTENLKVEFFLQNFTCQSFYLVFMSLYNHEGQSYFAQHKCYQTHTHQHLRKTRFLTESLSYSQRRLE